jgi:hypothetical protein
MQLFQARAAAGDVIGAGSAGIQPSSRISRTTRSVMEARGVPFRADRSPKKVTQLFPIRCGRPRRRIARSEQIEQWVRVLAEHFRRANEWNAPNPLYSEECAPASLSL